MGSSGNVYNSVSIQSMVEGLVTSKIGAIREATHAHYLGCGGCKYIIQRNSKLNDIWKLTYSLPPPENRAAKKFTERDCQHCSTNCIFQEMLMTFGSHRVKKYEQSHPQSYAKSTTAQECISANARPYQLY